MANNLILVVDDDDDLREFTISCLEEEGIKTVAACNGQEAVDKSASEDVDLVLLDLNLPDIDGEDVLKKIKQNKPLLPVIIVSGKQKSSSKVLTLGLGADDYVTKPYCSDELVARIKVNIKKYQTFAALKEEKSTSEIVVGKLALDLRNLSVQIGEKTESLSPRLFSLLRFFMENPGKVFDKKHIYANVWGDGMFDDNTVTVFIRKLRRIIEDNPSKPSYILTVWGEGYKFSTGEN